MVKWQGEKAPNKTHKLHSNPGSRLCWERGSLGSERTRRPTNPAFSSLRFNIQGELGVLNPLDLKTSKLARMGRVGDMFRHPRVTRTQPVHSIHRYAGLHRARRASLLPQILRLCREGWAAWYYVPMEQPGTLGQGTWARRPQRLEATRQLPRPK